MLKFEGVEERIWECATNIVFKPVLNLAIKDGNPLIEAFLSPLDTSLLSFSPRLAKEDTATKLMR